MGRAVLTKSPDSTKPAEIGLGAGVGFGSSVSSRSFLATRPIATGWGTQTGYDDKEKPIQQQSHRLKHMHYHLRIES